MINRTNTIWYSTFCFLNNPSQSCTCNCNLDWKKELLLNFTSYWQENKVYFGEFSENDWMKFSLIVNAGRQMMDSSLVLVLLVVTPLCLADNSATVPMTKTHTWSGNFEGHFILPITHGDLIGWEAIITFNVPVTDIQVRSYLDDQSKFIIETSIFLFWYTHILMQGT